MLPAKIIISAVKSFFPHQKWTEWDFIRWQILPEKFGGGDAYLMSFKAAWIRYNKYNIAKSSERYAIPPLLLAGVAFVEVGGTDFIDEPVFLLRSTGSVYASNQLFRKAINSVETFAGENIHGRLNNFSRPEFTSMGSVSIQLRRAAETLGIENPSEFRLAVLAKALQSDVVNLDIVANHLSQLVSIDFPLLTNAKVLSDDQIRIVGTRYYEGPEVSMEKIKLKSKAPNSYGNTILKRKALLTSLLTS